MIRRLLRACAITAGIALALAAIPAALAAAVLASDVATEYKIGALWFLACLLVVSLGAATAVAVSRWRSRRAEARHQVTRALLHAVLPDAGPRRHPVYGSGQPRAGALYVKSSSAAADDTAQLPAIPAAPDFSGVGVWDPREARTLHGEIHDVVSDPELQTLLDQIDDLPDIDDERREWLRAQALRGVPARTLLDASHWAEVDRRTRKPKPYPNGGR